jgi:hypothetical protein
MAKFEDLEWKPHPIHPAGKRAVVFFPNGYGASVIQSRFSYGGEAGKYELAVLSGNADHNDLTYETPITDDVLGWLSEAAVTDALVQIAALPAREHTPA